MVQENTYENLAPKLLVAMPTLKDSYFERTVVLLCDYTQESAFGLVINVPSEIEITEILVQQLDFSTDIEVPLLIGGPVKPDSLWVIHSSDYEGETTSHVTPKIRMSALPEILIALDEQEGPQTFHLGCGYAGWGPKQLDHEIQEGAWWLLDMDANLVLHTDYRSRWNIALQHIGIDPISASYFQTGSSV